MTQTNTTVSQDLGFLEKERTSVMRVTSSAIEESDKYPGSFQWVIGYEPLDHIVEWASRPDIGNHYTDWLPIPKDGFSGAKGSFPDRYKGAVAKCGVSLQSAPDLVGKIFRFARQEWPYGKEKTRWVNVPVEQLNSYTHEGELTTRIVGGGGVDVASSGGDEFGSGATIPAPPPTNNPELTDTQKREVATALNGVPVADVMKIINGTPALNVSNIKRLGMSDNKRGLVHLLEAEGLITIIDGTITAV